MARATTINVRLFGTLNNNNNNINGIESSRNVVVVVVVVVDTVANATTSAYLASDIIFDLSAHWDSSLSAMDYL